MPVAGRKPKPEGQAVNRHKPTHDWIEVVDVPFQGGPKLPKDGRTWPTWTKRWWGVVSTMPHCVLWTDSDWEFALDTAVLKAKFHTEPATVEAARDRVRAVLDRYPVYPEIDLDLVRPADVGLETGTR